MPRLKKAFFESVSLLLALVLVAVGAVVLRWPGLILAGNLADKASHTAAAQTAATLVGAFWGSGAVFLGAWINDRNRKQTERERIEQQRQAIRKALWAQFISICGIYVRISRIILLVDNYFSRGNVPTEQFCYPSLPLFLFSDALTEQTFLLEALEIGASFKFHQKNQALREELLLYDEQTNSRISRQHTVFITTSLLECLQAAIDLAEILWLKGQPSTDYMELRSLSKEMSEQISKLRPITGRPETSGESRT